MRHGGSPALLLWGDYWLEPDEMASLRSDLAEILPDKVWERKRYLGKKTPVEPEDTTRRGQLDAMHAYEKQYDAAKARGEDPYKHGGDFEYGGERWYFAFGNEGPGYIIYSNGTWLKDTYETLSNTTGEILDLVFSTERADPWGRAPRIPGARVEQIQSDLYGYASSSVPAFLTALRKRHPYAFYSATEGRRTA